MGVLYGVLGCLSATEALPEGDKQQDKVGGCDEKGRGMCRSMTRRREALGRVRLAQHARQAGAVSVVQLLLVRHLLPSHTWFDLVFFINVSIKRLELI